MKGQSERKRPEHWPLRFRVFLFFALIAVGGGGVILGAAWLGFARYDPGAPSAAFFLTATIATFGLTALVAVVWRLFDENVAKPVIHLASELRARAHADVGAGLDPAAARYLGDLAPAAAAVATGLRESRDAVEDALARKQARLIADRAQLEAALRDAPTPCLLISLTRRIAFYNKAAMAALDAIGPIGLGRRADEVFDRAGLEAAVARLEASGADAVVEATLTAAHGGAVVSARLRRLSPPDGAEGCAPCYVMTLADAPAASAPAAAVVERDCYGDLSLLAAADETESLALTNFVVFDTETTGLEPNNGDEIVQIGAVRIVNGRVLEAERFETLVNPERSIPARSTEIHGVTAAMVADAPTIVDAGRRFHAFCGDAALIAHNAPFDLAFLHRHAPRMGVAFDHPVLDTVLLSAATFGKGGEHSLDALVERLGVALPAELRHTALGDAMATAHAAVKMLAMLEGRGVRTWRELRAALAPVESLTAKRAVG